MQRVASNLEISTQLDQGLTAGSGKVRFGSHIEIIHGPISSFRICALTVDSDVEQSARRAVADAGASVYRPQNAKCGAGDWEKASECGPK